MPSTSDIKRGLGTNTQSFSALALVRVSAVSEHVSRRSAYCTCGCSVSSALLMLSAVQGAEPGTGTDGLQSIFWKTTRETSPSAK